MSKWSHFRFDTNGDLFDLEADIVKNKKDITLLVWHKFQIIYSRNFETEKEAIDNLYSFGAGYEYLGYEWTPVS